MSTRYNMTNREPKKIDRKSK